MWQLEKHIVAVDIEIIPMVRTVIILEIALKMALDLESKVPKTWSIALLFKCSPQTSSSITWEFIRNEVSLTPLQTY